MESSSRSLPQEYTPHSSSLLKILLILDHTYTYTSFFTTTNSQLPIEYFSGTPRGIYNSPHFSREILYEELRVSCHEEGGVFLVVIKNEGYFEMETIPMLPEEYMILLTLYVN